MYCAMCARGAGPGARGEGQPEEQLRHRPAYVRQGLCRIVRSVRTVDDLEGAGTPRCLLQNGARMLRPIWRSCTVSLPDRYNALQDRVAANEI